MPSLILKILSAATSARAHAERELRAFQVYLSCCFGASARDATASVQSSFLAVSRTSKERGSAVATMAVTGTQQSEAVYVRGMHAMGHPIDLVGAARWSVVIGAGGGGERARSSI